MRRLPRPALVSVKTRGLRIDVWRVWLSPARGTAPARFCEPSSMSTVPCEQDSSWDDRFPQKKGTYGPKFRRSRAIDLPHAGFHRSRLKFPETHSTGTGVHGMHEITQIVTGLIGVAEKVRRTCPALFQPWSMSEMGMFRQPISPLTAWRESASSSRNHLLLLHPPNTSL